MKKIICLSLIITGIMACNNETKTELDATNLKSADFDYMDTTILPTEDFYMYANGTWVKNNPLPSTESRWSSFNEVETHNKGILKNILETAAADKDAKKGSNTQLIGDYYASILDTAHRNGIGISPIQKILDRINNMKSKDEIATICTMFNSWSLPSLFTIEINQDLFNNNKYMFRLWQDGLGLPDKSYYFMEDSIMVKTREQYVDHIQNMFAFLGYDSANSAYGAETIMNIENYLAAYSMDRTVMRNDDSIYHSMPITAFYESMPHFDWNNFIAECGIDLDTIIIAQPDYFKALNKLLATESLDNWKIYFSWKLISGCSQVLTTEIENENFDFYKKKLRGANEMKPLWERAIETMNRKMGDPLGQEFIKVAFKQEAKEKMEKMVEDLRAAFKVRIQGLEWMSDQTKAAAIKKLEAFTVKIGYPKTWKDYSEADISRDSYAMNYFNVSSLLFSIELKKIGKPVDWDEWGMPAQIVNAYFNPAMNEVVFPAGILQPPFFDPEAEEAVNYSRMGMVIGHEFTHGFDDGGSKYDFQGKYVNWWTADDSIQFAARTKKIVDQYDLFEPLPGLHIKGSLTLGENMADFGGLTIAYYAYKHAIEGKNVGIINSFTPEQRFFIAAAQIWKSQYADGALRQQVLTNPHSPGMYRVLGPLANMPEFFDAFDVKEGDEMRQPTDKIAVIW